MSSYFSKLFLHKKGTSNPNTTVNIDELGIDTSNDKKKTFDVDLDAFMNPASGSLYGQGSDTNRHVQQLIQTAK